MRRCCSPAKRKKKREKEETKSKRKKKEMITLYTTESVVNAIYIYVCQHGNSAPFGEKERVARSTCIHIFTFISVAVYNFRFSSV